MGVKKFIKKSVAFVAAAAMALTIVVAPVGAGAGTSYAAEGTEDNLHLSKGIELQPDGNYKITLEAYSTGKDTITTTEEAVPLDIVLVLDQSGSMSKNFGSTTRLGALKNAVTNFVNTVKDDATKNDVNHRISMVGFASTKEETGGWFDRTYTYPNTEILTVTGNSAVNYKTASDNNTTFENALKNSLMNVRTQSSKITQAINMLDADGDTYSEYGMDMASRILAKYPVQEGENRKQIIVMFTDGYTAPSGTDNIDYSMSDRAISNAKVAKVKAGKKKVTISVKKVKGAKGYLVQYSTNKKFKGAKSKYVKKNSATIKKLKSKKTYYFRVKAYKMNGKKKVLSKKWSAVKKVKVK